MPDEKALAVSNETHSDVESLKRRLSVVTDEDQTQDSTVEWLLEYAPNPEDVENTGTEQ